MHLFAVKVMTFENEILFPTENLNPNCLLDVLKVLIQSIIL